MREILTLKSVAEVSASEASHLSDRCRRALANLIVVYVNCIYQVVGVGEVADVLGISRERVRQIKYETLKYDLLNPVTRRMIKDVIDKWATKDMRERKMREVLNGADMGLSAAQVQRIVELIIPIV
jgi:hypothetical protein